MFVIAIEPENSLDTTATSADVTTTMNQTAIPGNEARRNLRPTRNEPAGQSNENDPLHPRNYPNPCYMTLNMHILMYK